MRRQTSASDTALGIRSNLKGGGSPRQTLRLLYTRHASPLLHGASLRPFDCLLDLNLPEYRELGDSARFYDSCAELITALGPDEVGIGSMGVNSHVALHLGSVLRKQLGTPVTVGGIHLSSIAETALALYADIDRVATPQARRGSREWWGTSPDGEDENSGSIFGGFNFAPYFAGNPRHVANLTAGAGCKYRCAFCYSPSHYGG